MDQGIVCSLVLWIKGIHRSSRICKRFTKLEKTHEQISHFTHDLAENITTARRGLSKRIHNAANSRDTLTGSERSYKTRRVLSSAADGNTRGDSAVAPAKTWTFIRKQQLYKTSTGKTQPARGLTLQTKFFSHNLLLYVTSYSIGCNTPNIKTTA